jgi:hypothetical protein
MLFPSYYATPCPPSGLNIVVITAMWEREPNTENETSIYLKSLVHNLRCDAHLIFMVTDYEVARMRAMLAPLLNPGFTLNYSFTMIDKDMIERWADQLGAPVTHHSGAPGYAKFLLPELLPSFDRVVALDNDMIIGTDLTQLWNIFDTFQSETLFAHVGSPKWLCGCVGVFDLSRMRAVGWASTFAKEAFDSFKLNPSSFGRNDVKSLTTFGDQSMFIVVASYYHNLGRQVFTPIPQFWNLDRCGRYSGVTPENPKLPWGAVHFNCIFQRGPHNQTFFEQSIKPWDTIYQFYAQLPWVWLNGARMTRSVNEVTFDRHDERKSLLPAARRGAYI